MNVKFDIPEADKARIAKIVTLLHEKGFISTEKARSAEMDLTACHANGNPLKLQQMVEIAEAGKTHPDWVTLIHDVGGIRQNINRHDGSLTGHFTPRLSA